MDIVSLPGENDQDFIKWKEVQVLDPVLSIVYDWAEESNVQNGKRFQEQTKSYWAEWPRLLLHNGVLCRKYLDVKQIHISCRYFCHVALEVMLIQLHNHLTGGHLGTTKPIEKVKKRFYWYKYKEFIENWVKNVQNVRLDVFQSFDQEHQ